MDANAGWAALAAGRRGFTFIEILFAVVILGVGMIMIAGMLPVAIKQNADTRNDLTARIVCETGYAYLKTLIQTHPEAFPETTGQRNLGGEPFQAKPNSKLEEFMDDGLMKLKDDDYTPRGTASTALPPDYRKAGRVLPLTFDVITRESSRDMSPNNLADYPLAWHQTLLADRVVGTDPRFQWLAFYRRDEGSNTVRLFIVAMRLHNADVVDRYGPNTTMRHEGINAPNGPFLIPCQVQDMLLEPDRITLFDIDGNQSADESIADAGAYLIVAHSPPVSGSPTTGDVMRPFRNNGRIFRLGQRREDLDPNVTNGRVWELMPGFDLPSAANGADGIAGTPDDIPDGSMNPKTITEWEEQSRPTGSRNLLDKFPVTGTTVADGTTALAWMIGRGRTDPSGPDDTTFTGPPQDLSVLVVDVPLP